jgi:uncharacterized membrane protein YfcA
MTGAFVFPGILFLQALDLDRERLVQAMGMLFGVSSLALAAALGGAGLLTGPLALASVAALAPSFLGMELGRRARRRLSEARFRRVFFIGVGLLGGAVALRAALG